VIAQIDVTGAKAHRLDPSLANARETIYFQTMKQNRGLKPNAVKFFQHMPALNSK
jgi:hypothetical protein